VVWEDRHSYTCDSSLFCRSPSAFFTGDAGRDGSKTIVVIETEQANRWLAEFGQRLSAVTKTHDPAANWQSRIGIKAADVMLTKSFQGIAHTMRPAIRSPKGFSDAAE
jgi:hypothetical protein